MSKVLAFPRPQVAEPISYEFEDSWPEEGLTPGCVCLIEPGIGEVDKLVVLNYRGGSFLSRLLSRDVLGNITFRGCTGKTSRLRRGQYTIEGTLIKICEPKAIALLTLILC